MYFSPRTVTDGLLLALDAADKNSYKGSGTVWKDLSGNSNNGTLTNGPTFNNENLGIFSLDGTNDTISTGLSLTSTPALSNFTYEIWMKIEEFPTAVSPANAYGNTRRDGVLFGSAYYAGTALYWRGDTSGTSFNLYAWIRGTDLNRSTSTYSILLNRFYHCVMVNNYTSNLLQLYINGVLYNQVATATQEYNSSFVVTAGNIGISKPQVDGGGTQNYSYLKSKIGLARIYTKALSSSQVLQNFSATRSRFGL